MIRAATRPLRSTMTVRGTALAGRVDPNANKAGRGSPVVMLG